MLQTQLFTKTRKEVPADEVSKNAQLLLYWSRLPEALIYFASSTGERRGIVASPTAARASDLAGQLAAHGLSGEGFHRGRDAVKAALGSADQARCVQGVWAGARGAGQAGVAAGNRAAARDPRARYSGAIIQLKAFLAPLNQ